MLTITVKYLSPTNSTGARVKAFVAGNKSMGSVVFRYYAHLSVSENFKAAAQQLESQIAKNFSRPENELVGWEYTSELWLFVGREAVVRKFA